MIIEKLKAQEPFFGAWHIDSKLAEGKNSQFFKVYKAYEDQRDFLGLKVIRFPSDEKEISDVIASGKYTNVDEYLDELEQNVKDCMNKMLSLRGNKNIVRFDDFTVVREPSCFYVLVLMELLTPLSDYIRFDSIDPSQVVTMGIDLASALQGFRNVGIIHHGVKPENIYVDMKGAYKLGDFGFTLGQRSEVSAYCAPELFTDGTEDISSDIYALGILMYKLLNDNRTPFLPAYPAPVSLSDREEAFQKSMRGEAFPKAKNADEALEKIILTATAFNPIYRYFTPSLMGAELERYLAAAPVAAFEPIEAVGVPISSQPKFDITANSDVPFDSYGDFSEESYFPEEELEAFPGETKKSKAVYFLILALVIILCVIIALIFGPRKNEEETTTLLPPETTTEATTTAPTTEETTTEETTTEETTTEPTTTEPTTTEETTTEPTTTEETTTETTTQAEPTVPTLVVTDKADGDEAEDGRIYYSIEPYTLEQIPVDEFFTDIVISTNVEFGENPITTNNAYVCQVTFGGVSLSKVKAIVDITSNNEDYDGKNTIEVSVEDGDFYYEPEHYQYYICFDEGAIESDDKISLPIQIKVIKEN